MENRFNPYPAEGSQYPNRSLPRLLAAAEVQSNMNMLTAAPVIKHRQWDAEADMLALFEHNAGHSADEIAKHLISRGFEITRAQVVGSLYKQGVQNVRTGPMPATAIGYPWSPLADAFALAGYNANKTLPDILASLMNEGYNVTADEIIRSLARQGKTLF